jgi:hypothetical protein
MHWFDRLSEQFATASEARTSRRVALKGVALATVAVPLLPEGVAQAGTFAGTYAGNRFAARRAESDCLNCFAAATKKRGETLGGCGPPPAKLPDRPSRPIKRLAKPKPKKKKKKKAISPVESSRQVSCEVKRFFESYAELEDCRTKTCRPPPPPSVPPPPEGGGSTCSPGTTKCGDAICCYGGDSCCPCSSAGGLICCAAVIGCTCC